MEINLKDYIDVDKVLLTRGALQQIASICIQRAIYTAVNEAFPIGTQFIIKTAPTDGGDPNVLFPGTTWIRLKDCFIWAAGDNDTVDDTKRGRNSITANDIPYHKHKWGNSNDMLDVESAVVYRAILGVDFSKGYAGTFTCSKLSKGSWSNSGIVTSRTQTSSGSYGWSGTDYQTSEYTLNISHKHSLPSIAGNKRTGATAALQIEQPSSISSMDIKNTHISRYVWERTA